MNKCYICGSVDIVEAQIPLGVSLCHGCMNGVMAYVDVKRQMWAYDYLIEKPADGPVEAQQPEGEGIIPTIDGKPCLDDVPTPRGWENLLGHFESVDGYVPEQENK